MREPRRPRAFLFGATLFLSSCFICAVPAFSQPDLATINGLVTDPQGAVVAGADVTVTSSQSGVRYKGASNSAGLYSIQNLPIGQYTVTVEHNGFRRYVREAVTLTTGENLGLNVQLQLGATSQAVTVAGQEAPLQTRTSDESALIESKDIEQLPLNNRLTLNILELAPATVFIGYSGLPGNSIPVFSSGGGRSESNGTWIDGGNGQNIRFAIMQINVDPPIEAVAEVKVIQNNYPAEYGSSGDGVVIETTKSGGNAFHGAAYEFLRNNDLNAPGFFAPVQDGTKQNPELRYSVFGGAIGGPIRKNKTFFFFDYQGQRQVTGASTTLTVPTALQDAGNFSQTFNASGKLIPIYDPNTTQMVNGAYTRTPFSGNIIPASELDPVGLKAVQYFPLPNQPASNLAGANNFNGNEVTGAPTNYFLIKPEHIFNDNNRISGYDMQLQGASSINSVYPDHGAGDTNAITINKSQYAYASWTHILDSSRVNELRFTYNYRSYISESPSAGGGYPAKLGLTGVPDYGFPVFAAAGFSNLGIGGHRLEYPIDQQQVADGYSWVHGRHAMKFGFEFRRGFNQDVDATVPSLTFAVTPTALPGNTATGNGLASLLVGFPTAFSEVIPQALDRHTYYWAAFAQDDWTAKPSLTLNLGLRWETDTPLIDENNRMNGFNASQINPVSGTPGVVTFMGLNGTSTAPYHFQSKNFGPRLGFAWKAFHSDKIVVRGGFGVFFDGPFSGGLPTVDALGFNQSQSLGTPDNGITAPFYLRNGVPAQTASTALNSSYGAVPVGKAATTAVTYLDPTRSSGYSEQFNFGVEYQLTGSTVVEASMLANLGRKLPGTVLPIDQILPSVLGPACDTQACRPYPQFNGVSIESPSIGLSNYYAGVLRIQKRYSHGLNLSASYTYSKYLANNWPGNAALGTNNGPYSNYYDRQADYGLSPNDVRNHVIFSWIYELPFGTGKRWLASNPVRYILGGWSIGDVTTLQSGPPVTIVTQTNSCNCFSAGSQRPNVVGSVGLSSQSTSQWFNTAAFAEPANFTFGNEGVGVITAPGIVNTDVSLIRSFPVTEHAHLEARGEFFNATNHTNLGLPGATFGASTFGVISSAGAARTLEMGLRFAF